MHGVKYVLVLSFLVSFALVGRAYARDEVLSGYLEYRGFIVDDELQGSDSATSWRLRPTLKGALGSTRYVLTGDATRRNGFLEDFMLSDHDSELSRAYLETSVRGVDVRAGKQAVHWGSAHIWNPTDPLPEIFIADPWAERQGVKTLRFDRVVRPSDSRILTLVSMSDDEPGTRRRHVLRYSRRAGVTDTAFLVGYDDRLGQRWLGLDLRGDDTFGWWVEGAWRQLAAPFGAWYEVVLGVDYSFDLRDGLLVVLQYYRNSADLAGLAGVASMGSHLSFTATLTHDEDVSSGLTILRSVDDGSMTVLPQVTWKLSGTDELIFGGRVGWAGAGIYDPTVPLDPLGLAPERTWYVWWRRYF